MSEVIIKNTATKTIISSTGVVVKRSKKRAVVKRKVAPKRGRAAGFRKAYVVRYVSAMNELTNIKQAEIAAVIANTERILR